MGWSFRRRLNLGPLRINLSRKGAGFSVGVRGFRIGRDAVGRQYTQTSIQGTGIYRRDYYQKGQSPPAPNAPTSKNYLSNRYFWLLAGLAAVLWILLRILR
jgi:hypothetical protein